MAQPHTAAPPPLWFHLLAGPNGAGKSTLYRALVREGLLRISAIVTDHFGAS